MHIDIIQFNFFSCIQRNLALKTELSATNSYKEQTMGTSLSMPLPTAAYLLVQNVFLELLCKIKKFCDREQCQLKLCT